MKEREIKFRAWSEPAGCYTDKFVVHPNGAVEAFQIYQPFILEQFTDMRDINGIEIYEGDIIRIVDEEDDSTGVVTWYNAKWCYFFQGETDIVYIPIDQWQATHWQVIGNIHENEDLLKEDENECTN